MPLFARAVADEHDALLTSLAQQRDGLRATVLGLDDDQARATPTASSLCWVLLHLIKETARHTGHADIIREALDGERAGKLTDAYDSGQPT